MPYRISRGFDVPIAGAPDQCVDAEPCRVSTVAWIADDFPRTKLTSLVEPGDRVRLADPVAVDVERPRIRHTAPGAGVVREVVRGERRNLLSVVIELEGARESGDDAPFESTPAQNLSGLAADDVKRRLLDSGLWTALRTRPFDRVPDPDHAPHSIFVTAMDSAPLAARPEVVLAGEGEAFVDGLRVVARLTPNAVHVCRRPGAAIPAGDIENVRVAEFAGPHPAGLVGTHVHLLDPVGPGRAVWYLGYQDVIAIGKLFTTGRVAVERVVSLAGPRVARPRLLTTRLGAHIGEIVAGELEPGESRILSGSPLGGRQASGWGRFLGRYHSQICALEESGGERGAWFGRPWRRARRTTALHGRPTTFFPTVALERAMPAGLLATPLLRALLVGDAQAAAALGCLELGEEDLALCTYACPGKQEYGAHLRAVLERIECGA